MTNLPHATTISRALANFSLADFQTAFGDWLQTVVDAPEELAVTGRAKIVCILSMIAVGTKIGTGPDVPDSPSVWRLRALYLSQPRQWKGSWETTQINHKRDAHTLPAGRVSGSALRDSVEK